MLRKATRKFTTTLSSPGIIDAVSDTFTLANTTNLPTDTQVDLTIDRVDSSGTLTPSKEEVITGTVSGGNIINAIRGVEGTAQAHASGAVVEVRLTASQWNDTIDEIIRLRNAPQGFLLNGKIVPSVGSNNLTVALKTLAGTDPSASDPVHIRIGDTIRTITSALSVTKNAGTNWCNAGSSELATKETDYFVYLGYNATDGVTIGFSRIPYANLYSDFSATTTNEKYCAISTITNAVAGDTYENVGRFSATLSAGAGYTWTVPTFTSVNLIQRPIFETRMLDWVPTVAGSGSMTISSISFEAVHKYQIRMNQMALNASINFTTGGTASNTVTVTYPFAPILGGNLFRGPCAVEATTNAPIPGSYYISTTIQIRKYDGSNWDLAAGRKIYSPIFYQI